METYVFALYVTWKRLGGLNTDTPQNYAEDVCQKVRRKSNLSFAGTENILWSYIYIYIYILGDQKVSVHMMITVQKHATTQCIRKIPTQLMIWRWPSQNTFEMWTVLYWTRSSRTQFGVPINVWRLAGDTLNITCNFLYCNHQVHRDFLITLLNGLQLKSKHQHTETWSTAARLPRRLCYRSTVFTHHPLLITLSLTQGKTTAVLNMWLFHYLFRLQLL
jgi:hypothetical protein